MQAIVMGFEEGPKERFDLFLSLSKSPLTNIEGLFSKATGYVMLEDLKS